MRVLFVGGTRYLGRHTAEAAVVAGDDVTLLHRGVTGADLFPGAERLLTDRNLDLSVLAGRAFEATIDMCAYFPRQVTSLAEALDGRGGRYVQVSTVSVYRSPPPARRDEEMPLLSLDELDDPHTEELTLDAYGALKAGCEQAARAGFGDEAVIVRPSYIVGPYDASYRFTYWVERLARGGQVLAPGPADNPFQCIDVRDLGQFLLELARTGPSGTFHVAHPAPPLSFGELLELVASQVAPPGTELVWVDAAWLEAAEVSWQELPLWAGVDEGRDLMALDPSRALAAGLRPRPVDETIRDLHAAEAANPTVTPAPVGLVPEREAELLAAWSAGTRAHG